jgi:hypothetical protein
MTTRRATNQMTNDRPDMMRVAKDAAKHSYAQGTVNLRAVSNAWWRWPSTANR